MAKAKQVPAPAAPTLLPPAQLFQAVVAPGFSLASLELAFLSMSYAPLTQQVENYSYNSATRVLTFALAPGAQADLRYVATASRPASEPVRLAGPALTALKQGGDLFIWGAPECEILPGDCLELQVNPGAFQVMYEAPGKPAVALKAQTLSPNIRSVIIPAALLTTESKLYLRQGLFVSAPVYLNRARLKGYRSKYVLGGCPLELHGVNLLFPSGTSGVRLVTAGGQSYPSTIDRSKSHMYGAYASIVLPDTTVERQLDVYYTNGLPGATEIKLPTQVTQVVRNPNPVGLNEAYAHRFDWTNNVQVTVGAANDRPAILAAAQQTKVKNPLSGTVEFVGSSGANMRWTPGYGAALFETDANVLFYSKDPAFKVNYNFDGDQLDKDLPALFYWMGTGRMGIANLTFVDKGSQVNYRVVQGFQKDIDGYICHNVTLRAAGMEGFQFNGHHFASVHFTNSIITNAWGNAHKPYGPVGITNFDEFSFTGGFTSHALSQHAYRDGTNLWVANNSIELDASAQTAMSAYYANRLKDGQKRHMSIDFVRGAYIWNNIFTTKGVPISCTDLEIVLAGEGGGDGQRTNGYAQPESVNGTTLVLQSLDFISNLDRYGVGAVVTVISGPGKAQRRTITAGAGRVLTVNKPFDVNPTTASWLAFANTCLSDATIGGGTMSDAYGPMVNLGYRCDIESVIVADIEAERCAQMQLENGCVSDGSFHAFTTAHRIAFLRNTLDNGNQTRVQSGIHLVTMNDCPNLTIAQGGGPLRGSSRFNIFQKGNTIIPNPNPKLLFPVIFDNKNSAQFAREGFIIATKNNRGFPIPSDLPAMAEEGGVMQDCTGPLLLNEAANYLTLARNNFSAIESVAVGLQEPAQAVRTIVPADAVTEAIPAFL